MWACRSHSSPQLLQVVAQASSSDLVTLASYSVWRLATRSVAVHTSAQSRHSRMHLTSAATSGSLRSSSAQAVQAWAQSDRASMVAASTPASMLKVRG
jgi:hypothetical protein